MRLNLRWVRHNSAARFVSTLLRTGPTRINGTKGINSQVPFGITCTRVARHCYPPGDLLLPFGQFTLCRACGDGTACVAAEYLALRIGRGMGAHCAPLRKKKSSAVPLFGAVSSLRFSPCPLRERGRFTSRRKPQVVSCLCPRRAGDTPTGVSGTGIFIHPV